jgi:hypothetical protein
VRTLSRHQKWLDQQGTISGDSEASREIKRQVALLSEADRAEFWEFGQAPIYGEIPSEHGIFWTNCIDVEIGTSMFIRTCRLNHSCTIPRQHTNKQPMHKRAHTYARCAHARARGSGAPSVRIKWQNGALNSVATRDIASGEVCVSCFRWLCLCRVFCGLGTPCAPFSLVPECGHSCRSE